MHLKKILIVDDMDINREMLAEILSDDHEILMAENGTKAMEIVKERSDEIGAVLLDLIMPGVDGYQVLQFIHDGGYMDSFPVLIITGEDSLTIEKKCFELGVSDFIRKPFDNTLVQRRVENVTELYIYKNTLEEKVESQTAAIKSQYRLLKIQAEELKRFNENVIDIIGSLVEYRDMESGEHIQRVKGYTEILAKQVMKDYPEYGLTDEIIDRIVSASALHDVGKIAVSDAVLMKPGRLTPEEFEQMKTHTTRGYEMLKDIEGAWSKEYGKYSLEICRHHHEKYDGKGYPDGLVGDNIPISAQLVSVADVYDALVSVRCYKSAFTNEEAFNMIQNGECGCFSPKLMDAFAKTRNEFEALSKKLNPAEETA